MKLSKDQVKKVAKLASLPIEDNQTEVFSSQLTKILDHIDQIEKADTNSVDPTYNVSPNINSLRKDDPSKSLTQEEALQNAPNPPKNGQFITKGVFESE